MIHQEVIDFEAKDFDEDLLLTKLSLSPWNSFAGGRSEIWTQIWVNAFNQNAHMLKEPLQSKQPSEVSQREQISSNEAALQREEAKRQLLEQFREYRKWKERNWASAAVPGATERKVETYLGDKPMLERYIRWGRAKGYATRDLDGRLDSPGLIDAFFFDEVPK